MTDRQMDHQFPLVNDLLQTDGAFLKTSCVSTVVWESHLKLLNHIPSRQGTEPFSC